MKIAMAQMRVSPRMEENYRRTLEWMEAAARQGADLICFPEIQLSPFFPQYEGRDASRFLISLEHQYVQGIREACARLRLFAAPNFYVRENGRAYDMSLLIGDDGALIGTQKMVHIAQCERFYERDYYAPSEEGFRVWDTKLGKIGIVVCFDRHYPESVRTEALRGAELILIPTANTTSEPEALFQWEIRVQAFQNSVNIAMCNRVGMEGDMEFCGQSIVADYEGNEVALAGNGEELCFAELHLPLAAAVRRSKPYTSLRRSELYE
ncbi:MAG: carbon-nitrogen hydrolase family protein [Clostridia bacterium]|nr:carbon-nitrogen hydrolase family protein [Clostridia bacterium]